jgi:phospholipid/cholesterol/gamma-HCH transport system ATP-binding protein
MTLNKKLGSGSAEAKLSLQDVKKSFGRKEVLSGINLSIPKGKSLVVIGGSGSGKSVMLKCALGLIQPDSGKIRVDGQDTTKLSDTDRNLLMHNFGMLFQGGALFDSLPVWHNVGFGLISDSIKPKDAREIAITKLKSVGLSPDVADLFPAELSGGMQKRVSLARAIATDPEIIFFDEPTTGLDPIMADVINDLIIKCCEELGATTLSITHDMASARKIADDIAMLYRGQIIWQGAAEDIDDSGNVYVDQFIHGRAEGPIKMELT